jgi:hypothetical protein
LEWVCRPLWRFLPEGRANSALCGNSGRREGAAGQTTGARTRRRWVEVRSIRGHIEGDEIAHFQVELRVGFKLEEQ